MQRLEVSCAIRRIYTSLGAKGLSENELKAGKEHGQEINGEPAKTVWHQSGLRFA